MDADAERFTVDVSRWVKRAKAQQDLAFRAITQAAVDRVKELTPVDTGFLRANWQVVPAGAALPKPSAAPDSAGVVANAKAGEVLLIVNPVEYAPRINFGFVGEDSRGRKIAQTGRHMVEQTIREMPALARRALAAMGIQ